MPEYLKRGKPEADRAEDDAKVRATVEAILKDIEARGDAAVREYSERFDKYAPASFRLSLEEIDQGVERSISIKRAEHCKTCGGNGAKPGTTPVVCATCAGRGQVHRSQGFFTMATTCPRCCGGGMVIESPCADCKGSGKRVEKSDVKIQIPAGIEEGVRLRVPEAGDAGEPGAPRGDLYCVIRETEHKIFQRSGADLITEMPFSFTQLALGDKVAITSLDLKMVWFDEDVNL